MYGDAIIHRIGVGIGCLGLAALMPYGVLSPWLAVALAVLPIAVLEFGAELVDQGDEGRRPRLRLLGWHLQAYGALLFLTPFAVFTTNVLRQQPPLGMIFVLVSAFGAPSCALIIFRWRHVLWGRDPRWGRAPSPTGESGPGEQSESLPTDP